MAESFLIETETPNPPDPSSKPDIFSRTIEFHPAKKPFKGFSTDFPLETLNPSSSEPRPPASATGAKKHDGSELLEYGLDPELSFGITFRRIGAGLRNLGNTCFLNSVLQCLTYTEPLAAYLQSGKHKSSCRIAGFCALCAIQNHVSRALQSTGRILSPEDLVGNLRCISRNFRNARQEDAHEYMVNLLESMHKCCLPSGVPSESPGAYEKSLVHKIFGGRLRSQVKCQQCSYCSNKFDPFLDLSLEIFKADSLHKALSNFTAAEWLDGGERQYQCQQCKQKVRALKQLTVHKAPYVLTIHLKRFHAHDPGQKIKKKVQFGCSLDMKPFVSGSYDGDLKYSLYGVLVHSGSSTHSGHYYCYVRTSNNVWYTLDDNRVSHVSEREVLNQQAYMLFYVRDKKSIVPRKPLDMAKKENMKVNVNGNKESSASNLVLKEAPNGPTKIKHCGGASLTAEAQNIMSSLDSSKVCSIKDDVVQQKNSLIISESVIQSKKPVSEPSSKAQPRKDSPEMGLSVPKLEPERLSSSDHSVKDYGLPDSLKSSVSPAGDTTNICNVNGLSKDVKRGSFSSVPCFNNPPTSCANDISGGISQSQKVGASAAGSVSDEAGSAVCENNVGDHGLVHIDSVNTLLSGEGVNVKHMKKSKKKFPKLQLSRIHLRPTFLLMAYLGPRKKNHKRSKRRKLGLKNPHKENMDEHAFSSALVPSTPGKADVLLSMSNCAVSMGAKAGYRPGAKSNDESMVDNTADGELRKRMDCNGAVLATAMQEERTAGCGSVVNQFEAIQADSLRYGKRDQMHNNLMSMLTRGLEETVVARWDDLDSPPSQSLEAKNDNIVSIGYVGDEWDEEYDKGKRKKLRNSQHSFDGPNLFQEIATEKYKNKKAKLDHSSSGNLPFRI